MHNVELVSPTFLTAVLYWIEKIFSYWYLWVREFGVSFLKICFRVEKINMMANDKSSRQEFSMPRKVRRG